MLIFIGCIKRDIYITIYTIDKYMMVMMMTTLTLTMIMIMIMVMMIPDDT